MSTIRVDTISSVDDEFQIQVKDLANKDSSFTKAELTGSGVGQGADLIGYKGRTVRAVLSDVINIKDAPYGVLGNNTAQDRANLISALNAGAAAGKVVVVPPGIYQFNDWIPLPDKLKLEFMPGAKWVLTAVSTIGGFLCGGYTEGVVLRPFTDAEIYNLDIEGSSIPGENGFNAVSANNIKLYNPKIKNFVHDPVKLGGRAFQFEGGLIDGIHIYDPYVESCSIGGNSQGDPAGGTEKAHNINYYNPVMVNVDVPFNVDGQFANPQNGNLDNCSTNVYNLSCYNCGKLTFPGNLGAQGAGIFSGDRGFGLHVRGARIYNNPAYGGIGALVRGTLFNCVFEDVIYEGTSTTAVVDFTAPGFGAPSTANFPNKIKATGITVKSNLDYVIKTGGGASRVGASEFSIAIDAALATLAGVVDVAGVTTATLDLTLTDQAFISSGVRTLANVFSSGNTTGIAGRRVGEGPITPVDTSGASLVFSNASGYYVRSGKLISGFVRVDVPATSSTAAFKIGGLPFTGINLAEAGGAAVTFAGQAAVARARIIGNTTEISFYTAAGAAITNTQMASSTIIVNFSYLAAA